MPDQADRWRALEAVISRHSRSFGYGEIRTPVFEESGLFIRTAGASSDIVRKEMYTFRDLGGRSLTLRPEGTAPVARAYLENGLASAPQPVKLWYVGPMFRYDRPQAGRFRQHTQYGIEVFGATSPLADIEVILVAYDLFARLGLEGLVTHLNSIGCPSCRPAFHQELVSYFRGHLGGLCDDCRERFERNPLRIFDCKNETCRALLETAPLSVEHLCGECAAHHARLKEGLAALDIDYVEDPRLVRGLDYYTRTVFELFHITPGEDGTPAAQDALCGGGRYDGLIEELGGLPTPGVGFGMGLERLLARLESQGLVEGLARDLAGGRDESTVRAAGEAATSSATGGAAHGGRGVRGPVFVAAAGESTRLEALRVARTLRAAGCDAQCDLLERSLKAQFRAADRAGAVWAVLVGEEEWARGVLALRDLRTGKQSEVEPARLVEVLSSGGI